MCDRRLRRLYIAHLSLGILATRMILRYHLLLLLLFHIDRLCYHVTMTYGVNFLVVLHKESL